MTQAVSPPVHGDPGTAQLLVFFLDEQRYALDASAVERVTRMVRVTPLPVAPEIVLGVVNVQGRVLPVVDARRRFGLPARQVVPEDSLILARTARRRLALAVDRLHGVIEHPETGIQAAGEIVPGAGYVRGVAKLPDGMLLIHDLETFLSLDEEGALGRALEQRRSQDEGSDAE